MLLMKKKLIKQSHYFFNWKKKIENVDKIHNTIDPHGIFKYHKN